MDKRKMTNNDLQNNTHKTKDQVTQTPLKTGSVSNSCSTSGTRRVNLVTNLVISHE
jgi:hypothetical protein